MATQIIEFDAPSGLTLAAQLFAPGSDVVAYTASAVTESTNRKGVYQATFAGVAAGTYQLIATSGGLAVASWWGNAADVAATFIFGANVESLDADGVAPGNLISRIDAAVSTRLASTSYTAPANSDIAAIKAKTDNLPSDPADASDIAASFGSVNSSLSAIAGYIDTEVAAIKAKTDQLNFTVAGQVDANSLTGGLSAAGVRAAIGMASANLDSQLSGLPGIKAKTDQLTFTVPGQVDANSLSGGLDAAGLRAALGMASANLDLQLSAIDDFVDLEVAAIKVVTDKLNSAMELDGSVYRFTANALERGPGGATVLDANLVSVNGSTILAGDFNFTVSAGGKLYQGKLDLVPGDEYLEADGTAITFTDGNFPDLDGFISAKLTVKVGASVIIDHHSTNDLSEASKTVSFDVPEEVSILLADYVGHDAEFDVEAHRPDGSCKTIARGPAVILDPLD